MLLTNAYAKCKYDMTIYPRLLQFFSLDLDTIKYELANFTDNKISWEYVSVLLLIGYII